MDRSRRSLPPAVAIGVVLAGVAKEFEEGERKKKLKEEATKKEEKTEREEAQRAAEQRQASGGSFWSTAASVLGTIGGALLSIFY